MGPKKTTKRRLQSSSPISSRFVSMKLRSGSLPRVTFDQEASSHVMPLATPPPKRGRPRKRCIYVDDEAEVEEDSNNINDITEATGTNVEEQEQEDIPHEEGDSGEESGDSDKEDNQRSKHKRQFGKKVPLGLMKDVLGQFYVKRKSPPPLVPLCRLVPHEAVRFASDTASWLVSTFDTAAYVETMGVFLVSLAGPSGSTMPVTTQNLEEWGPIWTHKHLEFERSLNKEWQDLKGKKFFVWDGNHRLKTWMKRIKDQYAESPEYHSCVRCQFIEVDKTKEGELLLALDTTNAISRAHVTPNISHEVYMFQKFGIANKESILSKLSEDDRKWAEVEMSIEARYYHGTPPWYSTPCVVISQLVWKDEFNTYISNETAKIKGKGLPEHETKKKIDAAIRSEEERLKDRGYKYLSIANPDNGEEFFKVLYGLKWDEPGMLKITRDKLYCLCSSKIPSGRKKVLLQIMSLTKAKDPQYMHFGDYKTFRNYMKKEVYWAHMYVEASLVIQKLEVEGPQLPPDFEDFYKSSLKCHIIEAFASLLNTVKSSDDQQKMPELDFSAKRLLFRWFMHCKEEKILVNIPSVTEEWVDLKDENTMYSPTLQDRGITDWEAGMCPWWIDYPIGVIPKQEKELRARFMTEHGIAGTSDTLLDDVPDPSNIDITHAVQDKKGKKKVNEPSQKTPEVSKSQGLETAGKSNAAPSSSFVVESSIGRPAWERRPITRSVGFHYTTVVDALLVDIRGIDKFALKSIHMFLSPQKVDLYNKDGVPCKEVARLIFADFPNGLLVDALATTPEENMIVPKWNLYSKELITGTMDLAHEFLADEGFLVTMCLAEHIGELFVDALKVGLTLHRTWTLMCDGHGYRHPVTREAVLDLTLCLWHRIGKPVPSYDRDAGAMIDDVHFPAKRSYVLDCEVTPLEVQGIPVRGGAERSLSFFRWLLTTFTERNDYVLDVFAGCGGLGRASIEEGRHCLCMEIDDALYEGCLSTIACGPMPHVGHSQPISLDLR